MRKLNLRPVLTLKLIILASANSAIADTLHGRLGEPAWQPGWSGYVQVLAGGYGSIEVTHPGREWWLMCPR
jgi:hypothetical protein